MTEVQKLQLQYQQQILLGIVHVMHMLVAIGKDGSLPPIADDLKEWLADIKNLNNAIVPH